MKFCNMMESITKTLERIEKEACIKASLIELESLLQDVNYI
jgi:hypothetical protein